MAQTLQVKEIKLTPGQFFFGGGRTRVHTLLGSCIAITLWHPRRLIGGMCHYLLPSRGSNRKLTEGHFADETIKLFLEAVQSSVPRPVNYEAKLFGGSDMFAKLGYPKGNLNVARKNIDSGIKLLQDHGFNIKATDVGGSVHRKIFLELWNGDVWVQRGPATKPDQLS